MEDAGFTHLSQAPTSILGQNLVAGHWSGATEPVVYRTKDDAATAYTRGWVWYKEES